MTVHYNTVSSRPAITLCLDRKVQTKLSLILNQTSQGPAFLSFSACCVRQLSRKSPNEAGFSSDVITERSAYSIPVVL